MKGRQRVWFEGGNPSLRHQKAHRRDFTVLRRYCCDQKVLAPYSITKSVKENTISWFIPVFHSSSISSMSRARTENTGWFAKPVFKSSLAALRANIHADSRAFLYGFPVGGRCRAERHQFCLKPDLQAGRAAFPTGNKGILKTLPGGGR